MSTQPGRKSTGQYGHTPDRPQHLHLQQSCQSQLAVSGENSLLDQKVGVGYWTLQYSMRMRRYCQEKGTNFGLKFALVLAHAVLTKINYLLTHEEVCILPKEDITYHRRDMPFVLRVVTCSGGILIFTCCLHRCLRCVRSGESEISVSV